MTQATLTSETISENTLQKLFSRDPLKLTRHQLSQIVESYREKRFKHNQGSATAGKPTAKKSAKQKEVEALGKKMETKQSDIDELLF